MTDEQARQEVRRRCGEWGQVWPLTTARGLQPGEPRCVVGRQEDDAASVVSRGDSWQEALADADANGH
jgi:hypothetical protein